MYRLPRPFEVGTVATILERIVEQAVDDEAHGELFAERLGHAVLETLSFNPMPQAIRPIVEIYANRSMFTGNPIESQSMQRLSATERKRAWTSDTAIALSQGMSKVSWDKVVLSPVQIEHMVRGYAGWAGSFVLASVDTMLTEPMTGAAKDPAKKFYEHPVMKRFVRSNPTRHSKYVSAFYDQLRVVNEVHANIRQAEKLNELAKVEKMVERHGSKLRARKALNKISRRFSKMNAAITQVWASHELTPAEKREQIDKIQAEKNLIAKTIVKDTQAEFR